MDRRQVVRLLCGSGALLSAGPALAMPYRFGSGFAEALLIDNGTKSLTVVRSGASPLRLPIAIGRVAMQWSGRTSVVRRVVHPWWQPPQIVRRDRPALAAVIPPGPRNPLGTRALELARPEYAIHGTNDPSSIGRAVSYGCFRMHNRHIEAVFELVAVGTPVHIS